MRSDVVLLLLLVAAVALLQTINASNVSLPQQAGILHSPQVADGGPADAGGRRCAFALLPLLIGCLLCALRPPALLAQRGVHWADSAEC